MRIRNRLYVIVMILGTPAVLSAQEICWLHTPAAYRERLGGRDRLGPIDPKGCDESNRRNFGGQGSCECSGTARGTTNLATYGVQTAISSFMAGWQRGREIARQREAAAAAERAVRVRIAKDRIARLKLQEEEERATKARLERDEFTRIKEEIANELKRTPTANSAFDDLKRTSGGDVGGLKRAETGRRGDAVSREWQKMKCRVRIALGAGVAALRQDWNEARYLAVQSEKAAANEPIDVGCPADTTQITDVKCSIQTPDGSIQTVPCDETPLMDFYQEVEESTTQEIDNLIEIERRFSDLPAAKEKVTAEIQQKKADIKKQTTESGGCTSELCKETQAMLDEALKEEAELDAALANQKESRARLERNVQILQQIRDDPNSVNVQLGEAAQNK